MLGSGESFAVDEDAGTIEVTKCAIFMPARPEIDHTLVCCFHFLMLGKCKQMIEGYYAPEGMFPACSVRRNNLGWEPYWTLHYS